MNATAANRPTTLVRELPVEARSYIDPRATHVAWAALQVVSLRLGVINSPAHVSRALRGMADVLLHSFEPARTAAFTRIESVHDKVGRVQLKLSLGLGVIGAPEEAAGDAEHLVRAALATLRRQPAPLSFDRVDPAELLTPPHGYAATITQRQLSLADDSNEVRVVSRWDHPAPETWEELSQLFTLHPAPLVMQASFAATQLSPTEALELEQNALAGEQMRLRAVEAHNPVLALRAARMVETISDLAESYSGPLWVGSVVVASPEPLPRPLLRSFANAISAELDVIHAGQAAPVVAARARLVGGYEIDPAVGEAADTLLRGLPAAALRPRRIAELFSPTEAGLAFRFMLGQIPTLPVESTPAIAPPVELPERGINLGCDSMGKPVYLEAVSGHVWLQGATGAGKSTALLRVVDFALDQNIPFALLDPHGSTVRAARALALEHRREVGLFDPKEEGTLSLDLLGGLDVHNASEDEISKVVGRAVVDAASSHLPDTWSGVRWQQLARAAGEIAITAAPELRLRYEDISRLMVDLAFLDEVLSTHPGPSRHAAVVLQRMHRERDAETSLWASSKFDSLACSAIARALFSPFHEGVSTGALLGSGIPLLADLSDGSRLESRLAGHVFLTAILDYVFIRPTCERSPLFLLVDEAHTFPPVALSRALAESRKYGVQMWLGNQSAAQLEQELGSALEANASRVFFRLGLSDAHYFAPLMGLSADDLTSVGNLQAVVQLPGKSTFSVALDPPHPVGELPRYVPPATLNAIERRSGAFQAEAGRKAEASIAEEGSDVWHAVLARLALQGSAGLDALWLSEHVRSARTCGDRFEIVVDDAHTAEFINAGLRESLQAIFDQCVRTGVQVVVRSSP